MKVRLSSLEQLLDDFITSDPEAAERFIVARLERINVKKMEQEFIEREIDRLWGEAGHGTRRLDIERAVKYGMSLRTGL
jgi:hypothetical protein